MPIQRLSPPVRNLLLGWVLFAIVWVSSRPLQASVTFFSDRAIEKVAAKLELPEPLPEVSLPSELSLRQAELDPILAELEAKSQTLVGLEDAVHGDSQGWESALDQLDQLSLERPDRLALAEHGVEALDPERQALLRQAQETFASFQPQWRRYFSLYDEVQALRIRAGILGQILYCHEAQARLEGELGMLSRRKSAKILKGLAQAEYRYRVFAKSEKAKNHHRALSAIVAQRRSAKAMEWFRRKLVAAGQEEALPGQPSRWSRFVSELRQIAKVSWISAACLPAASRVLGYFYNPFRKESDPQKAIRALRGMSKSFLWSSGMELEVSGRENVPQDRPVIFAFSHRSEMEDAFLMLGSTPGSEYSFMMGQWAFPGFLNKRLAKDKTTINVGGTKPNGERVDAVAEGIETLKEGRNLVIFPEGMTPTDLGETQPLRKGIRVISEAVQDEPVAVVGVTLQDPANRPGGPRHKALEGGVKIRAQFSRPLDPLKLSLVEDSEKDLLRSLLRVLWHRGLFRAEPGETLAIPAAASAGE